MTPDAGKGFCLEVAAVRLRLSVSDPGLAAGLRQQCGAFLVPPRPDDERTPAEFDVTILGDINPGTGEPPSELRTWSPLYRPDAGTGRREVVGLACRGWIELAERRAVLTVDGPLDVALVEAEYFLRVVLALAAFDQGSVMLHAAAAEWAGRGYVFIGPSGAGKTTAARNPVPGAIFIQDDLVILSCLDGPWVAHATPFTGQGQAMDRLRPAQVEVRVISTLVKSTTVAWRSLPIPAALASLAACSPVISADPLLAKQLLPRLTRLAREVVVGELALRPDPGYWDVLP